MLADGFPGRPGAGSRRRGNRREAPGRNGEGSQHARDRTRTLEGEVAADQRVLMVGFAARVMVTMERVLEVGGGMVSRLGLTVP